MNATCDSATIAILKHIVGKQIQRVAAKRYPSYLAYSQIIVTFDDECSIQIELRDEVVAPKFEVFVIRATIIQQLQITGEWDQFEFGDFLVTNLFVLRREEWLDKPSESAYSTIGFHGVEQKFGPIKNKGEKQDVVTVDSGINIVSKYGAELTIEADIFPLVLQLRYEVSSSMLPHSTKVAIIN